MKRVIIILAVILLLAAGGFGVYYYLNIYSSESEERVSSDSEDAVYVETVASITGYGSGSGVLSRYSGEAVAQATLEVFLDSERSVKECYVVEGQTVTEGQKLFAYDTQEDEDKIAQDEIDIEKNQMSIESNETLIAQQEKLRSSYTDEDEKTEAYLQILSLENENRSYEYEIEKTQIEIESLQETIDDAVVTAEMGGYVQRIANLDSSDDGYSSYDSSSVYITILSEGDYRIKGTVNELGYGNLYEDMEMIVYSRTDDSQTWKGKITEISSEKDNDSDSESYYYSSSSDTSTYTFYVELEDDDGLLLGQHVYMEKDSGQDEEKDGLWLSEYYIMQEDGNAYVWMASTSNLIEKHEITLGDYDEGLFEYEVTDGLNTDDYIAYPMDEIAEGDPVYYSDIAVVSEGDGEVFEFDDDDTYYYDDDDDLIDAGDGIYYDGEVGEYIYYDDDWDDDDWDDDDWDDDDWDDDDWDDDDWDDDDWDDDDWDDD